MSSQEQAAVLNKARRYSSIKYSLAIIDTAYLFLILVLFQGLGISKILAKAISHLLGGNFLVIPLYVLVLYLGYYLFSLPLNFYQSYLLEHKFSLSNQNIRNWLKDQFKASVLSYIILLILISAFYYIVRHYIYTWWLVISAFWIFFTILLAKLTPTLIIPLFFKYKRLSDEVLRERILRLADKMKIKIMDCFEIDLSSKTVKANAAFVGWGRSRRVILADTLKEKYNHDEIEVILAHEFAHYKLKHLLKLILVNSFVTVAIFYVLYLTSDKVLSVFGASSLWDISALPVVLIYFLIFGVVTQPVTNFISRQLEKEADRQALKVTGLKEAFISMMQKLSLQNLSDPNPSRLAKIYFFDHPPTEERIAIAKSL